MTTARTARLIGDATKPTERGCMVTVACPCGSVFERRVTPEDATRKLVYSAMLAMPS